MQLEECISIGIKELFANKIRSILSVLGIIIGIVSLMIMMGIMRGIEQTWQRYTEETGGIERASIYSVNPVIDGKAHEELMQPLSLDDTALIKRDFRIRYVSPEIMLYQSVRYQGRNEAVLQVVGGTRDTLLLGRQRLDKGRLLTDEDNNQFKSICVIGTGVRDKVLGPNLDPVGHTIEIQGESFQVVGLLKRNVLMQRGKNLLDFKNDTIYIPISLISHKFDSQKKIDQIQYTVKNQKDIPAVQKAILKRLEQRHRVRGDVSIQTQEEQYLKTKKTFDAMKISFSILAGVSLIVGGIGIMNIMIASIAQRVREIGVRKAVGATFRDIMYQFLVETVVVSVLGGFLGILFSFFAVFLIRISNNQLEPVISLDAVFVSALFSLLIGISFGIYPALKAAKLDPIQALRYQ